MIARPWRSWRDACIGLVAIGGHGEMLPSCPLECSGDDKVLYHSWHKCLTFREYVNNSLDQVERVWSYAQHFPCRTVSWRIAIALEARRHHLSIRYVVLLEFPIIDRCVRCKLVLSL